MASKMVKCDENGFKIAIFFLQNHKTRLAAGVLPQTPISKYLVTLPRLQHPLVASVCSARGLNQAILGQKNLLLVNPF